MGTDIIFSTCDRVTDILNKLESELSNEDKRVMLMKSIISNPDQLKYTPPETKGSIIAQLIYFNVLDVIDLRNQKRSTVKSGMMQLRKEAIIRCFTWVQSKADYNNVMQHMTTTPAEGKGDAEVNEKLLLKFLGMTEFDFLGSLSTQYKRHLHTLYERLPDTVDPDEPFKSIPQDEMAEYIAFINEQHNSLSQMA